MLLAKYGGHQVPAERRACRVHHAGLGIDRKLGGIRRDAGLGRDRDAL